MFSLQVPAVFPKMLLECQYLGFRSLALCHVPCPPCLFVLPSSEFAACIPAVYCAYDGKYCHKEHDLQHNKF